MSFPGSGSALHPITENLTLYPLSSMVIRDLTLRSAASFGSFHLIRLLYDEYMYYLVEQRVAKFRNTDPVVVMGEVCCCSSCLFVVVAVANDGLLSRDLLVLFDGYYFNIYS